MNLLALDASTGAGSIALLDAAGAVLWEKTFQSGRREGGEIFTAVGEAVKIAGRADRIAVGLGPGSYSGIRQAVALLQGLRLAWSCELAGLPSAYGLSDEPSFQAIGDARRGSYYYTRIEDGLATEGPLLLEASDLAAKRSGGIPLYTVDLLKEHPDLELRSPSASLLGVAALRHWERIKVMAVEPFYLREPNITAAKKIPGLIEQQ